MKKGMEGNRFKKNQKSVFKNQKKVIDKFRRIVYIMRVACGGDRGKVAPGCSAVWLARVLWEHEAGGSNPFTPTQNPLRITWPRGQEA